MIALRIGIPGEETDKRVEVLVVNAWFASQEVLWREISQ